MSGKWKFHSFRCDAYHEETSHCWVEPELPRCRAESSVAAFSPTIYACRCFEQCPIVHFAHRLVRPCR